VSGAQSLAEQLAELAAEAPNGPTLVAEFLAGLTDLEAATLAYDWEHVWRKPKQAPPAGNWRTWGALTGRGFGKTRANAEYVHGEAAEGPGHAYRARRAERGSDHRGDGRGRVGLSRCRRRGSRRSSRAGAWSGRTARRRSSTRPRSPATLRPRASSGWASELHVWPHTKREEAFANLMMGLRLGYGRLVWDSNPSRRHPIMKELLAEAEATRCTRRRPRLDAREPAQPHAGKRRSVGAEVRRHAARARDARGRAERRGRGRALGQARIDNHRELPARCRRILVIDPAISLRAGTDGTGIVDLGLGDDGQVYVIDDMTKRSPGRNGASSSVKRYVGRSGATASCSSEPRRRRVRGNVRARAAKTRATTAKTSASRS
jgi:phage terminase large subunit-like protein